MKHNFRALIGVTTSLIFCGTGPTLAGMPPHFRHQPIRQPASPPSLGNRESDRHPHLHLALKALIAADQGLRSSAAPNVSQILAYLETAHVELQRAPPIFHGRRIDAMEDTQRAINHLKQTPPKRGAAELTEKAIRNTQSCLQMHP